MGHYAGLSRYPLNEDQTEFTDLVPRCSLAQLVGPSDEEGYIVIQTLDDDERPVRGGQTTIRIGSDIYDGDGAYHEAEDCPYFVSEPDRIKAWADDQAADADRKTAMAEARAERLAAIEAEESARAEENLERMTDAGLVRPFRDPRGGVV